MDEEWCRNMPRKDTRTQIVVLWGNVPGTWLQAAVILWAAFTSRRRRDISQDLWGAWSKYHLNWDWVNSWCEKKKGKSGKKEGNNRIEMRLTVLGAWILTVQLCLKEYQSLWSNCFVLRIPSVFIKKVSLILKKKITQAYKAYWIRCKSPLPTGPAGYQ